MKTIFFIKDAKKGQNDPNSINLRFYLITSKKYKVKGLGISCSKKDWNQTEQTVKRSNTHYKKYNIQLNFIQDQLEMIEQKRTVTEEDINNVVEASIKGITIETIVNKNNNLKYIVQFKYDSIKNSRTLSDSYKGKFGVMLNVLAEYEEHTGKEITFSDLNNDIIEVQNNLLEYYRAERKTIDNSNSTVFNFLNICINYFNKKNKSQIPRFDNRDMDYEKQEKEIVYLTTPELTELYRFTFAPNEEQQCIARPNEIESKYLKWFIFRCFSGMRISEQTTNNINKDRLDPFPNMFEPPATLVKRNKMYEYYAKKNSKIVRVPYINTYLFDIAESLNWEFPNVGKDVRLNYYIVHEKQVISKYLKLILGDNMRKIQFTDKNGFSYKDLTECISTHSARKTFAFFIYDQKKDIIFVKDCLNHSKLETTLKYLGIQSDVREYEEMNLNL